MAFDRRSLLISSAALASAAALPACKDEATTPTTIPADAPLPSVAATLAAVAFRLLPNDDLGPGAQDAGVDAYLAKAIEDPRLGHVKGLLARGAAFLHRAAKDEKGAASFLALDTATQDDIIGRLVGGKMRPNDFQGPVFVRFIMALTLEGFLGDPKHGGNKDQVAWKWLGFSPAGRAAFVRIGP